MRGQHTAFPPPLPFVSGPYTSQSRDRSAVGGDREEVFSDGDDGLPNPSSTFKDMMDLVYRTFPETHGQASRDTAPFLLGMQRGEDLATAPSLKWSQLISVLMSQASEALARANESTKLSFAKYPTQRYYRFYCTSSDKSRDCLK